ncbi:MAG: flagellar hook-length control protein FliK [Rubrivivax sp.]
MTGTGATAAASPTDAGPVRHEAMLESRPRQRGLRSRTPGAQVSVLVREGVQQAKLHLNPQELGPVLVRIQLEGQAAQVHLAADLPATRQALEQALPTLASQLADGGITLAGGGVFERPTQDFGGSLAGRQAGHGEGGANGSAATGGLAGSNGSNGSGSAGTTASAAVDSGRWSRQRGIVDLVA